MNFFSIIKYDYLQRTRSYAFLITLCASLAIAYTFVPEPNANYSTIRIADYIGQYNSAWFGYVTAIMTSLFLSLIGFYLVNSGIKSDIETNVGQIVATTKVKNFNYLLAKVLSNFLVLLTILVIIFTMSIILFFLYSDGYSFEVFQFIKPYVLIPIPTLFFVAVLAVLFEVFFERYTVVQNIGFFFLFSLLMGPNPYNEKNFSLDLFGSKIVMSQMEEQVKQVADVKKTKQLSIGYVIGNVKKAKQFQFNGVNFTSSFIISRFLWVLLGFIMIYISSLSFHRFNIKEKITTKKHKATIQSKSIIKNISLSHLAKVKMNFSIFPLLKTELLLLIRKGKKWLWFINLLGMVLLTFLPLQIAHQFVLPILWFLQVSRLSEITTKEITNKVHYFAFTSYKPIYRLLVSQIGASILLVLFLALPLLIRELLIINFSGFISILLGGVFLVLLSASLGIVTKGKKLFEVLFFMITYANINGIPFLDYFGALTHSTTYLSKLLTLILILFAFTFIIRKKQLKKL